MLKDNTICFSDETKGTEEDAVLPTPEEVIVLDNIEETDNKVIPRRTIASKSTAHINLGDVQEPLLPPAKSEPKIVSNLPNGTLVDNNFSPFRSKSAAQNGPKMKVFLPTKNSFDGDDSSMSSEDSSTTSSPMKCEKTDSNSQC